MARNVKQCKQAQTMLYNSLRFQRSQESINYINFELKHGKNLSDGPVTKLKDLVIKIHELFTHKVESAGGNAIIDAIYHWKSPR